MTTARVTSRGRITIPKQVRERLGLRPGDELAFVEDAQGWQIRKEADASRFERYRGHLRRLRGRAPDELVEEMRGPS